MFTVLTRKYCVQAILQSASRSSSKSTRRPSNRMYLSRYVRTYHHHVSVHVRRARSSPLSRNCRINPVNKTNANAIIFGIDHRFCSTRPESNAPIPEALLEHNTKRSQGMVHTLYIIHCLCTHRECCCGNILIFSQKFL